MPVKRSRSEPAKFEYKHESHRSKRQKRSRNINKTKQASYGDSDYDSECGSDYEDSFYGGSSGVFSKGNTIYFLSKVSSGSVSTLIEIINKKNKEFRDLKKNPMIKNVEPNPLYLHITSYGGCLFSGFRAVDAIQRSEIPIYTVIDGHAASAATLMSVVGVKRYMTPNSYMLIHQLSSGVIGKFWEMKDEYHNCKQLMDNIYDIYTSRIHLTREELEEQLSHDSWWNVEKCVEVGLVDDLMDKMV